MPQIRKQSFLQKWGGTLLLLFMVASFLAQTQLARDVISGWGYEPSAEVEEIRDDLALTNYGKRVFAATRPALETSESFNQHCENTGEGTNVLGCYLPSDDRVYVYDVTLDELKVSRKSTMAHELLHAIWERFSESDKRKVEELLKEEYHKHEAELGEVLEYYNSDNRMTELFARIGTEIAEVSDELEKYYARVFEDRQKIVQFYHEYAVPLKELRVQADALKEEILLVKADIAVQRAEYEQKSAALDSDIREFNSCANRAGCFTEARFQRERQVLERRQIEVEQLRTALNDKITENNERIQRFNEYQEKLGTLSDAMDSTAVVEEKTN